MQSVQQLQPEVFPQPVYYYCMGCNCEISSTVNGALYSIYCGSHDNRLTCWTRVPGITQLVGCRLRELECLH